jgi:P27 family predicted phage terminase small subunit
MRGRKPTPSNVVPLTGGPVRLTPAELAKKLRPRGLTKDERKEWDRVAALLADPAVDRLKPHFVDSILEYCRATIRLRAFRQFFADNEVKLDESEGVTENQLERVTGMGGLDAEMYVVHGRNGTQLKSHPFVAQMNEAWRQWRSLMMECGLSIASERNMIPGQGSLFDDPAGEFYGAG